MTLRESWLSTGATQADVYRIIKSIFRVRAIHLSTLKQALRIRQPNRPEVTQESRTLAQINRAFAEIRKE